MSWVFPLILYPAYLSHYANEAGDRNAVRLAVRRAASENKNRRWPTDVEFRRPLAPFSIYGSRVCQVILECLELSYGHHEVVSFAEATIEHVMPRR
jgi:hypothetical protein